jgi:hypothetical protein
MDQSRMDAHRSAAERAAGEQRRIQRRIDELDGRRKKKSGGTSASRKAKPVQTGARRQPANPLPEQHQEKPGDEFRGTSVQG